MLYGSDVPISGRSDSRESAPYEEKRTLPGTPADVSEFVCVAALGREDRSPMPGSGMLTRFPFDSRRVATETIPSVLRTSPVA